MKWVKKGKIMWNKCAKNVGNEEKFKLEINVDCNATKERTGQWPRAPAAGWLPPMGSAASPPCRAQLVLQALLRWATYTRATSWSLEYVEWGTKQGDRKTASGTRPSVKLWLWEQMWASSLGQRATYQGTRPSHRNEQDQRTGSSLRRVLFYAAHNFFSGL